MIEPHADPKAAYRTRRAKRDDEDHIVKSVNCRMCSNVEDTKRETNLIVQRLRREHPDWSLTRSWQRAQVEHMKGARK